MIKHIGRHNEKKVTILYRTVPGNSNMCLLVYSDLLPRTYHDAVMKILESDVGQQAAEFSDALHRNLLPDGRNILEVLHKEGLIRKVPTSQVIVTPDIKNSCRLDELNTMLAKIDGGKGAELAAAESNKGMVDPRAARKEDFSRTTSASVSGEVPVDTTAAAIAALKEETYKPDVAAIAASASVSPAASMPQSPAEILRDMKVLMADFKKMESALTKAAAAMTPAKRTRRPRTPKVPKE